MNPSPVSQLATLYFLTAPRQITVSQAQIEEMDDSLNSAMCDVGSCNALALELRARHPHLKDLRVYAHGNRAFAKAAGVEIPLGKLPAVWLIRVLTGHRAKPITFSYTPPRVWAANSPVDAPKR